MPQKPTKPDVSPAHAEPQAKPERTEHETRCLDAFTGLLDGKYEMHNDDKIHIGAAVLALSEHPHTQSPVEELIERLLGAFATHGEACTPENTRYVWQGFEDDFKGLLDYTQRAARMGLVTLQPNAKPKPTMSKDEAQVRALGGRYADCIDAFDELVDEDAGLPRVMQQVAIGAAILANEHSMNSASPLEHFLDSCLSSFAAGKGTPDVMAKHLQEYRDDLACAVAENRRFVANYPHLAAKQAEAK